jgi:hypothetical protein
MIALGPKPPWWADLAWKASGYLPLTVERTLKRYLSLGLPLTGLRVPVALLRGPLRPSGRVGTLLIAGRHPLVKYLPGRFFAREPQRTRVGKVWVWALPHALKRHQPPADLTIAVVDRHSARLFFDEDYLAVPEWVGSWLTVPEEPKKLGRANGSVREDLRKIRNNGLQPVISHSEAEFDLFYRTMYVPFIRNRFGDFAFVSNPRYLRRRFRQGGMLWVQRGGERLAGEAFWRYKQTLYMLAMGTANGESAPMKQGALAAAYYYLIQYAGQQGCTRLDLGGSRPSLHDGVLRYKRKWGVVLSEKPDTYYDFLVRWNRLDGVVADFLSHTSLIFRDRGGLSAISGIGHGEPARASDAWTVHHSIWIPGLRYLYLVAASGWQPDICGPPHTSLIDAKVLGDGGPRALFAARDRSPR